MRYNTSPFTEAQLAGDVPKTPQHTLSSLARRPATAAAIRKARAFRGGSINPIVDGRRHFQELLESKADILDKSHPDHGFVVEVWDTLPGECCAHDALRALAYGDVEGGI